MMHVNKISPLLYLHSLKDEQGCLLHIRAHRQQEQKQHVLWGNKHFIIANVFFWISKKPEHIKKEKEKKDLISSLNTAAVILTHHTAVQKPGSCPYLMCPIMHFPVLSS